MNFATLQTGGFADEDLVKDGWTDITSKLISRMLADATPDLSPEAIARAAELADFEKMEEIRARVDSIVSDRATAEALKPWYRQFCKRPCFHDEYLQAFNAPNVHLVDTDPDSLLAIRVGDHGWARVLSIEPVFRRRMVERLGVADADTMDAVNAALRAAQDL